MSPWPKRRPRSVRAASHVPSSARHLVPTPLLCRVRPPRSDDSDSDFPGDESGCRASESDSDGPILAAAPPSRLGPGSPHPPRSPSRCPSRRAPEALPGMRPPRRAGPARTRTHARTVKHTTVRAPTHTQDVTRAHTHGRTDARARAHKHKHTHTHTHTVTSRGAFTFDGRMRASCRPAQYRADRDRGNGSLGRERPARPLQNAA